MPTQLGSPLRRSSAWLTAFLWFGGHLRDSVAWLTVFTRHVSPLQDDSVRLLVLTRPGGHLDYNRRRSAGAITQSDLRLLPCSPGRKRTATTEMLSGPPARLASATS